MKTADLMGEWISSLDYFIEIFKMFLEGSDGKFEVSLS